MFNVDFSLKALSRSTRSIIGEIFCNCTRSASSDKNLQSVLTKSLHQANCSLDSINYCIDKLKNKIVPQTFFSKATHNSNANLAVGLNCPVSMELIVFRDTPTNFASSV